MKPYRAIPIGKPIKSENFVYGWYSESYTMSSQYIDIGPHIRSLDKDRNFVEYEVILETVGQFVCKDKNGKDVFAKDEVKWRPEELDELCEDEFLTAAVKGGFLVFDVEGTDFVEASHFKDIELIEESK